jgi:MFS transporter, DHA1 family, multidrug resistance protein
VRDQVDAGGSVKAPAVDGSDKNSSGTGNGWRPGVGFVLMLGCLMAFGPMAIDMYLPALPTMAREMGVHQAEVQGTLSVFLIGLGLGQLVWGPLGDRYGRRGPAAAGVLLFIVGSAGCALSDSIGGLIAWRAVQALGASAAPVLARAMVRDVFERDRAASVLSLMMLVMGVAPLLAPLAGGQVLALAGWPAIFWCLGLFGLIALLGLSVSRETLPVEAQRRLDGAGLLRDYTALILDRRFMGYSLSSGLGFAGMLAYISGSPFVYISWFGVPEQLFGFLFGLNVLALLGMSSLNSRLVLRYGAHRMLRLGCLLIAGAGLLLAGLGISGTGGIWGVVAGLFLYVGTLGIIGANATAAAMQAYPHMAGTASALTGTLQLLIGAVAGVLVGALSSGTPTAMCGVIGGCGVLTLVCNRWLVPDDPQANAARKSAD